MTITAQPPSTQHRWDPPAVAAPASPSLPPDPPRRPRRAALVAGVLAVSLVAGAGGGLVGSRLATPERSATATSSSADVIAAVAPSVVAIEVSTGQSTSEGTGIVLTSDGLVLTNSHVVTAEASGPAWRAGSAADITVTMSDGTTAPATVIGTDTAADIAVIRVSGVSGLTQPRSAPRRVSRWATPSSRWEPARPRGHRDVGHRLGAAPQRRHRVQHRAGWVRRDDDAVRRDPDRCCGEPRQLGRDRSSTPAGRVVGVTTAMATVNGESGSIGIGFAIPIDTARTVAQRLIDAA